MIRGSRRTARGRLIAAMLAGVLGGCASSLLPAPGTPPALFALSDAGETSTAPPPAAATAPTLVVQVPRAAPGFDTSRIVYVRRPYEIEYFAHNQWVDTPANLLAPMIVRAIERTGAFHAVLGAPTSATGPLRLESELVRLQQDFSTTPSHVRLTLRAALVDAPTRQVIASREFDVRVEASADDPYGGVVAAQRAASEILLKLAAFCAQAAAR